MSVVINEGIGFSATSKAAYIVSSKGFGTEKQFTVPAENPALLNNAPLPWVYWGITNDLPIKMAKDIEECGVLDAAIDSKARIAVGKGPMPFFLTNIDSDGNEQLEFCNDSEIHDWLEENDSYGYSINSCYDLFGYGWAASQLILSPDRRKITRIKRTDVVHCRLSRKDKIYGLIQQLFLNDDWCLNTSYPSQYIRTIPILEEGAELMDLLERNTGYEFSIINRNIRNGRHYYPTPLWYSVKAWVDVAKVVPKMKNSMFNNQMTIKYLVTISQSYWKRIHKKWDNYTSDQRKKLMDEKLDEIDKYLSGNDNQYKSIFANSYIDPVTKQEIPDIKIDVLDDKVKDGKLLPDSAAANSEILFAQMMNPAFLGAGQPGGPYTNNSGGSNIRESYMIQIMLLEWERRQNARIFNIVKKYNGWSKRLESDNKRLVFRYPSGLLTTLDTGKSTKPVITG